ncbi:hypothetical protein RM531_08240 [Salinisphaera sp. P385]|uniref:Uncharacterized protein n=1 Tax=Spectribacter acetivorans TaxID=3075603 RepID=A0ABU3B8A3_9GAMM|nr:hypothetical protein [Salinisphaera sp. P385]MDT0618464.1 hypothetical protein [Salinisphaera sp. P385]
MRWLVSNIVVAVAILGASDYFGLKFENGLVASAIGWAIIWAAIDLHRRLRGGPRPQRAPETW